MVALETCRISRPFAPVHKCLFSRARCFDPLLILAFMVSVSIKCLAVLLKVTVVYQSSNRFAQPPIFRSAIPKSTLVHPPYSPADARSVHVWSRAARVGYGRVVRLPVPDHRLCCRDGISHRICQRRFRAQARAVRPRCNADR